MTCVENDDVEDKEVACCNRGGVSKRGDRAMGFSSSLLPCATWGLPRVSCSRAAGTSVVQSVTPAPCSLPCQPGLWVTWGKDGAQRKSEGH